MALTPLDGGLATTLQARFGLAAFTSPTPWARAHPERLTAVHRAFAEAGARVLLAATFRGLPHLEPDWGLLNPRAIALARGLGGRVYASTGPVAGPGRRYADFDPAVARRLWQDHAAALADADGLVAETLVDPAEALACAEALRPTWPKPLVVSLCPREDGRLFDGSDPAPLARRLVDLGVDVVGVNCGTGARGCARALERLAGVPGPRWFKPNLGEDAEAWLEVARATPAEGVGGCCGVGPELLARLHAGRAPFTDP